MLLSSNIEMVDLSLYLKEHRALIVGDVHIGMEEALGKQGVLVPRFHLGDILERLDAVLGRVGSVDLFIINGDLKHEFGSISRQEWRGTLAFIDAAAKKAKSVVIIKGNHDVLLGPIAKKRGISLVDHLLLGDTYITHGDKIPDNEDFKQARRVIIGNEHPALSVRDDARSELFKCFLNPLS